jgi:choline dehydrogenase-like flavoprotein
MAWVPRFFGRRINSSALIGQLAFTFPIESTITAFGATFLASSLNASELLRHMPFKRRPAVDILSSILSSCIIGNIFLPGHLTNAKVRLGNNGELKIEGAYDDSVNFHMSSAKKKLKKSFYKMGAVILPGSFTIGNPGADVHYSGTLPMRKNPVSGETTSDGEVYSLSGLYIADGASLPLLPSKSHTFTIMANADRIGNKIVALLRSP